MNVVVLVMLGQVQPHADRHEYPGNDELRRHRLAQRDHRRRNGAVEK